MMAGGGQDLEGGNADQGQAACQGKPFRQCQPDAQAGERTRAKGHADALQLSRLQSVVRYARERSNFHRQRIADAGAAGNKTLSTTINSGLPTGVKLIRVRANSTTAAETAATVPQTIQLHGGTDRPASPAGARPASPTAAIEPIRRNGTPKFKFSLAAYSYRELLTTTRNGKAVQGKRGNLTLEEQRLIENSLTELRFRSDNDDYDDRDFVQHDGGIFHKDRVGQIVFGWQFQNSIT